MGALRSSCIVGVEFEKHDGDVVVVEDKIAKRVNWGDGDGDLLQPFVWHDVKLREFVLLGS